jgi:hypothetical protein
MTEGISGAPIRSPDQIGPMPRGELFAWFDRLAESEAEALRAGEAPPAEELWTQLAVQTRLETEVVATRWLLVAHLLRARAADTWWAVAEALSMFNAEAARAEFLKWVTSQVDLHVQSPEYGLTDETAYELREMAHALPPSDPEHDAPV